MTLRSPLVPALMRAGGIALACLLAASCAIDGENRVAQSGHPTIVSLNPCTDAILADVAAPGQLLAISHYSKDPASSSMDAALARRFRATSGSVEEVAMLAPDVVVAGSFLPPATRQALTDLGIRVVTLPIATDVAASQAQVVELARLTGNPVAGQELVRRIDASLEAAAPPEGAKPVPALVWEAGGIVAGDGTLIADMLQRAGFTNAAAARGLSQADFLPLERVVADPPRVIFAVGNAHSEEDRMLRHPAIRTLKGTDRVPLEGSLLWCGGPTIPRTLEKLARERDRLASRASSPRVTGT